jgi:hypothetical protein
MTYLLKLVKKERILSHILPTLIGNRFAVGALISLFRLNLPIRHAQD